MTKEELENIISTVSEINNQPNTVLIKHMDLLSEEFENLKKNIISQTIYLDKIEELYNKILNVYQTRNK